MRRAAAHGWLGLCAASLFVAWLAGPAWADSCVTPWTANVFSDNGRFFVRILPGDGKGQGSSARGEFYARQDDNSYRLTVVVPLSNPKAPTDALVSNEGYLITFDNWCFRGHGKAVVIYRADGRIVSSFELEELYDAVRLARIKRSVTQRFWRCYPPRFMETGGQAKVRVRETLGGYFLFDLSTGKVKYDPSQLMGQECPR